MTDTATRVRDVVLGATVRTVDARTAQSTTKVVSRVLVHPDAARIVYTDGTADLLPDGSTTVVVVT